MSVFSLTSPHTLVGCCAFLSRDVSTLGSLLYLPSSETDARCGYSASFPDIKSCAGDLETAYDDLSDAIKGFVSDDATEVADGLKDIAGAMTALKAALTDCKATEGDIEAFVTAMKAFKSPWDFIYHVGKDLIVNGADIFSEISDAVTQWEAQSYRQAGNDIGTALAQMVIGQDESA